MGSRCKTHSPSPINLNELTKKYSGIIKVYLNALNAFGLYDQYLWQHWHLNPFLLFQLISKEFIPKSIMYERLFQRHIPNTTQYLFVDTLFRNLEKDNSIEELSLSSLYLSTILVNLCNFFLNTETKNHTHGRKLFFHLEFAPTYDEFLRFLDSNDEYYRRMGLNFFKDKNKFLI